LFPLVISEPIETDVRSLAEDDPQIVTWAWTLVEMTSAIERRVRAGSIDMGTRRAVLDRLAELALRWDEVHDLMAVRRRAAALLARHPLRAADAAQLGAALLVADLGFPELEFVCLDRNLALAAEREGLRAVPAPV
jgi:uncharacterized protein